MKSCKLLIQLASVGGLLFACHHQAQQVLPTALPNQRPKAITIFHLKTATWETTVASVQAAGVEYAVTGRDSTHYIYDTKQRLVGKDLTQGVSTSSGTYPTTRSEYTYLPTIFSERTGIGPQGQGWVTEHPLDPTGYHVLSYTQKGYSYVLFDSLRVYSLEGILTSALQFEVPSSLWPKINPMPNRKVTVESGDVIRAEFYGDFTSPSPNQVIQYSYDTDHYGPLATDTFLGETSVHALVGKTITTYQANTSHVTTYTYFNTYDKLGRLTSQLEWERPTTSNPASNPLGTKILTKFYY